MIYSDLLKRAVSVAAFNIDLIHASQMPTAAALIEQAICSHAVLVEIEKHAPAIFCSNLTWLTTSLGDLETGIDGADSMHSIMIKFIRKQLVIDMLPAVEQMRTDALNA